MDKKSLLRAVKKIDRQIEKAERVRGRICEQNKVGWGHPEVAVMREKTIEIDRLEDERAALEKQIAVADEPKPLFGRIKSMFGIKTESKVK